MQGGSSGIGYGLKYQARCISDVKADTDHTSFLAGTLSLKEENEVHLIRLSSGGTELVCEGLFSHPNEIWDLQSCPFDQRIFSTVYSNGESNGAAVWQIPELYGELNTPQLERIASFDTHVAKTKCILWWPTGRHDKLISIDEENILSWSLDVSKKVAQVQSQESAGALHNLSGWAWDPHDTNSVAATCESSMQFWDLRTMKKSNSLECAHVQSVDYNPKKRHILVTAARVWHTHMGFKKTKMSYPRASRTYALTSGTDSTVNLWLASPPEHTERTSESHVDPPTAYSDPLLNTYSDYEDSVYGLAWSSREPWIFASLSYDGQVATFCSKWEDLIFGDPAQNKKSSASVWLKLVSLRVEMTVWQMLQNRLPTKDRIWRGSNNGGDDRCSFCNQVSEDVDHIFLQCLFSWKLWAAIYKWFGCQ